MLIYGIYYQQFGLNVMYKYTLWLLKISLNSFLEMNISKFYNYQNHILVHLHHQDLEIKSNIYD